MMSTTAAMIAGGGQSPKAALLEELAAESVSILLNLYALLNFIHSKCLPQLLPFHDPPSRRRRWFPFHPGIAVGGISVGG